jgi:hypothetical protein
MASILDTCTPRSDLLKGTFNPEIFTARLSDVMDFYRDRGKSKKGLYTDSDAFFQEATFPTQGLKTVLDEVFRRISGDNNVPAIHRLETAFGGGKTHALIAMAHLGFKGRELAQVAAEVVSEEILHPAGDVKVVGIPGEELPVHKPSGTKLSPYTLWGEIAFQVGGAELYESLGESVTSYGAPGRDYFEAVFGGRKVLVMLDELAQYATRLQGARQDGGAALGSFLMGLHGHARGNSGIAVVLTLASDANAFAAQTKHLVALVREATGEDVDEDEARRISDAGTHDARSVVARDATAVVPVQPSEISRVLARRLFEGIDEAAASATAEAYSELYRRHASFLPAHVVREDFKDRLTSYYPFHPAFIDYLNNKLATVEEFQGTRGVLRVLARMIRNIWSQQAPMETVHTCHLDLQEATIVNEVVTRVEGGQMLPVLNADVGGVDTGSMAGGKSNAQLADESNPHPAGIAMHEQVWKTVFLHSLVGRGAGITSNLFGITEQDAMLEVTQPALTPPQIKTALDEIGNRAYYLRFHEGRYYAHTDPTINRALADIRRTQRQEDVEQLIVATARKILPSGQRGAFSVEHDVGAAEDIPDRKGRPVLAMVVPTIDEIDVEQCVMTAGHNTPRLQQNSVFLLVPRTVLVKDEIRDSDDLLVNRKTDAEEGRRLLEDVARDVLARRRLAAKPEDYGIPANRVSTPEYKGDTAERENALQTRMAQAYDSLWYPSTGGQVARSDIRTAGGEGGSSVLQQVQESLKSAGELIMADQAATAEVLQGLRDLLFEGGDVIAVQAVGAAFLEKRHWPVLEDLSLVEQIVRAGVQRKRWCLFRMGAADQTKPEAFYGDEGEDVPFDVNVMDGDWELVTVEGARQREWTGPIKIDARRLEGWVEETVDTAAAVTAEEVRRRVQMEHGDLPDDAVDEAINQRIAGGILVAFDGNPDQTTKPEKLITGTDAVMYRAKPETVITTKREAARRGWVAEPVRRFSLSGREGTDLVMDALRELGKLYGRGATSKIDMLDLLEMELPAGGKLRLTLTDVPPDGMRQLEEWFEILNDLVERGESTDVRLEIAEPEDSCELVKRLRKET